jgi:ubiquinone/menaquinone biosynthesis C-methylase UbiE
MRSVTGLDLNTGMLAVARSVPTQGAAIIWIEGNALDLPFPADSFDMVSCPLGVDEQKASVAISLPFPAPACRD